MAIYEVQGPDGRILTIEGPDNAPEAEVIQQAHLLYTQQQAHEAKTGIGAAFKHGLTEGKASAEQGIATLLGAAGMKNYSQDWLNSSEAARKEAAGMYEGTTDEDVARARAENGPIAELLAKGKKNIAEPLGGMAGRFGPTMAMSAAGPWGLGAAGLNEYLASVGEVKHRGGEDTEAMLYGAPLAALNVAKIPTGRLGTYASEAVAKGLGRVTPEAAEAGVREAALAAQEAKAAEVAGLAGRGDIGPLNPVENLAVQEAKAAPFQAAQEAAIQAAKEVPGQRTWGGFAGDVAAGAVGNAAVNIPLSLASEALTRHATGEKPMSAEEAGELSQQLALLSPIFGAGHAVLHNPVRDAKLKAESAAAEVGVSPEALEARQFVDVAKEAKDQYDIDNTPFHPEHSADKLWNTLRETSGREDVPVYSDLSDEQRKTFNDAIKAKGDATRESKDQPGVYEPKKNTVTAFDRVAGKPEEILGTEAVVAPEAVKPEAVVVPEVVTEPTVRKKSVAAIKPAEKRQRIAEVSSQLFEQYYPGEKFDVLPDNVKSSWSGHVNSKWKTPESFTVPTTVRKYFETNTPEKAYQEAIGKLKVEPVSIEELKNTPPDKYGNTIWDSISQIHTPGKPLNINEVTQNVNAYHEIKANAEREAERQRVLAKQAADLKATEQAELAQQNKVYNTGNIEVFDKGLTSQFTNKQINEHILSVEQIAERNAAEEARKAAASAEEPVAPVEEPTITHSDIRDTASGIRKVLDESFSLPEYLNKNKVTTAGIEGVNASNTKETLLKYYAANRTADAKINEITKGRDFFGLSDADKAKVRAIQEELKPYTAEYNNAVKSYGDNDWFKTLDTKTKAATGKYKPENLKRAKPAEEPVAQEVTPEPVNYFDEYATMDKEQLAEALEKYRNPVTKQEMLEAEDRIKAIRAAQTAQNKPTLTKPLDEDIQTVLDVNAEAREADAAVGDLEDTVIKAIENHTENPTPETAVKVFDAVLKHEEAVAEAKTPKSKEKKPKTQSIDKAKIVEALTDHKNPIINWVGERLDELEGIKFVTDDSAGGSYDRASETITIGKGVPPKTAVRVLAHEGAHAIVSHALDKPNKEQKPYVKNLNNLYEAVKNHESLKDEYGVQDVHEFVSEGFSNPEFQKKLGKIEYKGTTAWGNFTNAVAKLLKLKKDTALTELLSNTEALEAIQADRKAKGRKFDLPAQHANDPLIKRAVGSGYTTMKEIEAPKSIPDRVKGMNSWMNKFWQSYVNEWHGVETTLAPHLGKLVGEKQRADLIGRFMSTAPNFITNALQMGGIEVLKDGTMDITKIPVRLSSGKVVNASIYEMQRQVDKIGKEGRDLFNHVAYVLDAADQLKRDPSKVGKHITDNMAEFRQHEKDVAALRAKYPELNDALDMWRGINKSLIKSAFDSGLINKKTRDAFMKNTSYSPRYMLREEVLQRLGVQEVKPTEVGNTSTKVFRERTAAEHQVNVWENMTRHYAGMTLGIMANETKKAIGEQFVAVNAAKEVERSTRKSEQGNLAVMVNGERKFYKVDSPELIPSMMQVQQDFGPLMKAARGATQIARTGWLSNPGYWARQIVIDPVMASLSSDLGWITPAHTMKELTSIMQGNNPTYELLARRGVIGHVDPSLNASDVHHFMDTVSRRVNPKSALAAVADKSGNFLNKMHIAVDGASRVAIYKAALLKAAKDGLHGKDAENYAVMMAREHINFSITGSSQGVKQARLLIPFLSATINSLDLLRKTVTASNIPMKERTEFRRQFLGKVATIGMLSAAYTMYMSGNEEYERLDNNKRYNNWVFPTGMKDHPVAIPLPPEFAFIKWLPEMMVRYGMGTQTAQQIMSAAAKQVQGMVPGGMGYTLLPIPHIVKPLVENWINTNTYTGEDIETKGEHYQLESDRSTALGNTLSQLGMSAPKWDHLFRSYGGELGMAAVWLADMMLKPENVPTKPDRDFVETPGLGLKRIFGSKYASQQRTDFYTHKDEVDSLRSRLNTLKEQGRGDEFNTLLNAPDTKAKFQMAQIYDKFGRQMQQLGKEIKIIEANKNITDEMRNAQVDRRKRDINRLAAEAEKIWQQNM